MDVAIHNYIVLLGRCRMQAEWTRNFSKSLSAYGKIYSIMATTGDLSNQPTQTPQTPQPAGASPENGATQPASASQNIAFRSEDIGTKTARKQDVFAEHKRKDAEKKAKQKNTTRKAIIFGGIALVVIVLVIILIIFVVKPGNNGVSDDGNIISEAEAERRQQITQSVYDAANAEGANAEEVFQEALDSAKTQADVDAVRTGQLQYYNLNRDYEKVVEVADQIGGENDIGSSGSDACESIGMDIWAKISCHNALALAYEYMNQYDDSAYHWDKLDELYAEADRLGLLTGE